MKQLSLKHFIVRSQTISLYRDIMRTLNKIDDRDYRKESRSMMLKSHRRLFCVCFSFLLVHDWARREYERNRKLTDLGEIRTQIALGRRNLNELKLSMQMAS